MKVIGRIVCIVGALALVAAFILAVCGATGCASAYTVSRHDRAVMERHALQAQAQPGGQGINLGLDVLGLTGYWQAWKDNPGAMTISTVADIGTAVGLAAAGNALFGDNGESKPVGVPSGSMGDDNTIIIGPVNGPLTIDQSSSGNE
jgi:hypothetical protein